MIPIIDNTVFEDLESFTVTLSNPQRGAILGSTTSFVVTINDDEDGFDKDQDGMPDAWELSYFGNLTTAGPGTDYDHDGTTDLEEFLQGLDPKNLPTDGLIGRSPSLMIGKYVFDPNSQVVMVRTNYTSSCYIWLTNNSDVTRSLSLWANGGNSLYNVKFLYKGKDVTRSVLNKTFRTASILPKGGEYVKVIVSYRKPPAHSGLSRSISINMGKNNAQVEDRVIYRVISR